MSKKRVFVDRPVWVREIFEIEVSDELLCAARHSSEAAMQLREAIDAALSPDSQEGTEELGAVYGMDRVFMVDGREV